jgi:hypothetical protein
MGRGFEARRLGYGYGTLCVPKRRLMGTHSVPYLAIIKETKQSHIENMAMYAVEFETRIDNGIVHIPEQYKTLQNSKKAKIIVMVDEPVEENNQPVFAQFLQKSMKVENLHLFDRDELHER